MAAQTCLTCLATDVRMCYLTRNNLSKSYAALVGYECGEDEGMPDAVCYICSRKLNKFKAFRVMSRRAYFILQGLLKQHGEISDSNLEYVDRTRNNLGSTLMRCNTSHIDIEPVIKDTKVDIDINIKKEVNCEQSDDFVFNKRENECTEKSEEPTKELQRVAKFDIAIEYENVKEPRYSTDCYVSELKTCKVENAKVERKATKSNTKLSQGTEGGPKKKVAPTKKNAKKRKVKKIVSETTKSDVDEMIAGIKQACAEQPVKPKRKAHNRKKPGAKQYTLYTKEYYEKMAVVTVMTREEQLQFFKQSRLKYASMMYKCKECEKGFYQQIAYDKHMQKHDPSAGDLLCWICKFRFKSKYLLLKHCCSHRTKLECKKCDAVFTLHQDFREHVSRKHPGTSYFCDVCQMTYDNLESYTEHVYGKHPESVSCSTCGATLFNKASLRKHRERVHQEHDDKAVGSSVESGVSCGQCGVVFRSETAYNLHHTSYPGHDTEHGLILRECIRCSQFVPASEMQEHVAAHKISAVPGPSRGVQCEQCGEHFETSRKYHVHFGRAHPDKMRTQYFGKQGPIMCELCGKLCPNLFMHQIHVDRHNEEKRFKCDLCDKKFSAQGSLKLHRVVHTKKNAYKCKECDKSFSQCGNLKRHQHVHTDARPYSCDICGKTFKSAPTANLHKRYVHEKKGWPKRNRTRSKKAQGETKSESDEDS